MLVFSMRLQGRSPPMMIHTKAGQGPYQPMHCCSLIFSRILPASNSRNDHAKAQSPPNLPPRSHQEDTLQMSHNLIFDFQLQLMKKPNPRAHQQYLLILLPLFLLLLPLNFFLLYSQIFFQIFYSNLHSTYLQFSSKNLALGPYGMSI